MPEETELCIIPPREPLAQGPHHRGPWQISQESVCYPIAGLIRAFQDSYICTDSLLIGDGWIMAEHFAWTLFSDDQTCLNTGCTASPALLPDSQDLETHDSE